RKCRYFVLFFFQAEDGIRDYKVTGVQTCALPISAEEIPDRATGFKCAPPIREAANQAALWDGLKRGVISMVVSDHSPCTPQLKRSEERRVGKECRSRWGGER